MSLLSKIPLLGAVLALAAGCGAERSPGATLSTLTVSGSILVHAATPDARGTCPHAGEFLWLTTTSGDRVLALSELDRGMATGNGCRHALKIAQVPAGMGEYKVSLPTLPASTLLTEAELRSDVSIELYPERTATN